MISILIPNHNEENIQEVIKEIEDIFYFEDMECEVIIARDRDGRGKGWALREALKESKGDVVCFLDGDMDIEPRMLLRLLPFLDDYDIVVGKKQIRGMLSRRIITLCSRLLIRFLFGMVIDTQTGIKAFRREALILWKEDGYMFDLEVLTTAKSRGKSIIEIPVEVNIERKMAGRSVLKCLMTTLRLWKEKDEKPNDHTNCVAGNDTSAANCGQWRF